MFDEDGNLTFKENPINNPRFHSDWCSMILSRLMHARNFLSDDGVIFISIDDHEQENLKKICNEVFGEKNFIAQVVWERAYSPVNLKKHFSESHDYILCYAKNIDSLICNGFPVVMNQIVDMIIQTMTQEVRGNQVTCLLVQQFSPKFMK